VYHVNGLTRAFASGLCAAIAVHLLPKQLFPDGNALFTTSFENSPFSHVDIALFIVAGQG
jgi:hypothetical protein